MSKRRAAKPSMRVKDGRTPPFVWFPNEVMRDYGAQIGPHAGWVYMALLTHANKESVCWPAHETLATMTGMSLAQVKVSLKKLQRLGLISITMRRPKTSIYTVLDVPEHISNSQDVAIASDPPNSQEVAINSYMVAINSQEVAIEQLPRSYEVDVLEVEPPNQNHSTISSPPPPSEVIAPSLQTEDDEDDGRFAEVWEYYPKHDGIDEARAEWIALDPDATLYATILEAIAVQKTSAKWRAEGGRFISKLSKWLHNRKWLDACPASAIVALESAEAPPAHCKERGCEDALGTLSGTRCDRHAVALMTEEAGKIKPVVDAFTPAQHQMEDLRAHIETIAQGYHTTYVAHNIASRVCFLYTPEEPFTEYALFAIICDLQQVAETERREREAEQAEAMHTAGGDRFFCKPRSSRIRPDGTTRDTN
jgi:hypothetical protein